MFKKYYEHVLIISLALLLSSLIALFLNERSDEIHDKSKFQISIENASNRWNDLFYKPKSHLKPSEEVIVLAIDEPSLIEIGRWPWSRSIINKITEQLLKYKVKTIAYDIIFSEKEGLQADSQFVSTISKNQEKLIFGTFSDSLLNAKPYQDFCFTQALLATGGENLVKINPFFAVIDETNAYEEYNFNSIFSPIFHQLNQNSENIYLKNYELENKSKLSQYQINTLEYYKKQRLFDYCNNWLTEKDDFLYETNPTLKKLYFEVFKVNNEANLKIEIEKFKSLNKRIPIPQYSMWRQNIDHIQEKAQYTASFVAHPDYDGIIRNYPLVFRTGNQLGTSYIPSLAFQAYLTTTGFQAQVKLEQQNDQKIVSGVEIYNVSGKKDELISNFPVDAEGKMLINYYGKQNTIAYISAKELLNSSEKLDYFERIEYQGDNWISRHKTVEKRNFLKGKNIIFGATAIGIYDIRTTPNDIKYPGPEIHATILSNLLNRQTLSYERSEPKHAPILFFIFITISLYVFIKTGVRFGVFYFFLTLISLILFQLNQYESGTLYTSSLIFVILFTTAYFLTIIYKYFFQSRRSNEIKKAFSKYVSKDVVEEILKNENAIELRGQKLNMSVFFSDIRGFTSFSESMDPVEVSELLNKYFTPMSNIIIQHQGTIDKYIGDAIMAMFGAPINYPNHAYQACAAALDCIAALKKINEEFKIKNWPLIEVGIGINSGFMNVGNIGSDTIQNYTVIGDSVNLASRLQTLNKTYSTSIIISEFTYEIVKDRFNCREIDTVVIRGRIEPVKIYELQGFN